MLQAVSTHRVDARGRVYRGGAEGAEAHRGCRGAGAHKVAAGMGWTAHRGATLKNQGAHRRAVIGAPGILKGCRGGRHEEGLQGGRDHRGLGLGLLVPKIRATIFGRDNVTTHWNMWDASALEKLPPFHENKAKCVKKNPCWMKTSKS